MDVELAGRHLAVDTGFMVFNSRTYPNLLGLFDHLGVAAQKSRMSFSVQCGSEDVEWSSNYLVGVFAQTGNVLRSEVWRMLFDIFRLSAERRPAARRAPKAMATSPWANCWNAKGTTAPSSAGTSCPWPRPSGRHRPRRCSTSRQ